MTVDGALLYPQVTARRRMQSLNGMWGFQFDPKFVGERDSWPANGLPAPVHSRPSAQSRRLCTQGALGD